MVICGNTRLDPVIVCSSCGGWPPAFQLTFILLLVGMFDISAIGLIRHYLNFHEFKTDC